MYCLSVKETIQPQPCSSKFHWTCFKGEFNVFSPLALLFLVFATVFTVEHYAARCLGRDAPKPQSQNSNLKHESPCLGTQTFQSLPAFSFTQLTTRWSCCLKNYVALLCLYALPLPTPLSVQSLLLTLSEALQCCGSLNSIYNVFTVNFTGQGAPGLK